MHAPVHAHSRVALVFHLPLLSCSVARCYCCPAPPSPQVWLVKLEGVESPEEAALLRGYSLLIPASARQALEDEDEFYVQVGHRVF